MLNLIILKIVVYFYLTVTVTHNVNYKQKSKKKYFLLTFCVLIIVHYINYIGQVKMLINNHSLLIFLRLTKNSLSINYQK